MADEVQAQLVLIEKDKHMSIESGSPQPSEEERGRAGLQAACCVFLIIKKVSPHKPKHLTDHKCKSYRKTCEMTDTSHEAYSDKEQI